MDNHYNDPLFIRWHTDSNGDKISVRMPAEIQEIVKGKIFLNEVPDMLHRVKINDFYEVNRVPQKANEFQVNYSTGMITFSPDIGSLLGKANNVSLVNHSDTLAIKIDEYYGRGLIMYPASRIYINLDENLEDFANTLQDIVSDSTQSEVKQLIEHFNDNIKQSNSIYSGLTKENKIAKDNIVRLDSTKLAIDKSNEEAVQGKKELDETLSKIDNTVTTAISTNDTLTQSTDRAIQARQDINNLDLYIDKINQVGEEAKLTNEKMAKLEELDQRAEEVLKKENLPDHIQQATNLDDILTRDISSANDTVGRLGGKLDLAQSSINTLNETINKSIDNRAALDKSVASSKEQSTLVEQDITSLQEQISKAEQVKVTLPPIVDKAVETQTTMSDNEKKIDEKIALLKENLKDADTLNAAANTIREGNFLTKGLHWGDFLKK